jgi:pantetheine-phosphate adenylyltransferase
MVREYASYGVSVKEFVPANVLPKIEEKMRIVKTTRGGI